jgi:hypothetical protein
MNYTQFLETESQNYVDSHFDIFFTQREKGMLSFDGYLKREKSEGHLRGHLMDAVMEHNSIIYSHLYNKNEPDDGLGEKELNRLYSDFIPSFIKAVANSCEELINQKLNECKDSTTHDFDAAVRTNHNSQDFQEFPDFKLAEGLPSFEDNSKDFKLLLAIKDEIIDVALGRIAI